jgi:hypothetical protein
MRCAASSSRPDDGAEPNTCEVSMRPGRDQTAPSRPPGTRTYQIRVAGLVPEPQVREALGDCEIDVGRWRTVLVGRFNGRDALLSVLQQLRRQGLEVLDVRRLPEQPKPQGDSGRRTRRRVGRGHYEVTLLGDVGPAVRRALDSFVAALDDLHTELRATAPPGLRFVDLVLRLESRGLRIASIAAVPQEDAGIPVQRTALAPLVGAE